MGQHDLCVNDVGRGEDRELIGVEHRSHRLATDEIGLRDAGQTIELTDDLKRRKVGRGRGEDRAQRDIDHGWRGEIMLGNERVGEARPSPLGFSRPALHQHVDSAGSARRGLAYVHELGVLLIFDTEVDGVANRDALGRRCRRRGRRHLRERIGAADDEQEREEQGKQGERQDAGVHVAALRGPLRAERETKKRPRGAALDAPTLTRSRRAGVGASTVSGLTAKCGSPLRDSPGFSPGSPSCAPHGCLPTSYRRRRGRSIRVRIAGAKDLAQLVHKHVEAVRPVCMGPRV